MDLKKEFKEYRFIYNKYYDFLQEGIKSAEEKRKQIIEKDKEDVLAQHDSDEKQTMLQQYMEYIFEISLVEADIQKVTQRILYIFEAAIRKSEDLELTEEDSKFVRGLSEANKMTYVIDNNGDIKGKVAGLKEVIKKRVAERKDMTTAYMQQIRKSPDYGR